MTKEEYAIITKLVNEENIDELKKYLEKVKNQQKINTNEGNDVKSSRNALMKFIDNNCNKEYPSYYARTHYHACVVKTYKGFYNKLENGFIISNQSNAFMLYDRSILTPEIEKMLDESYSRCNLKKHEEQKKAIMGGFDRIEKEIMSPVISKTIEGKLIDLQSADILYATVPAIYYDIAKKLLGKGTREYVYEMGVYFESSKGKALVMKTR